MRRIPAVLSVTMCALACTDADGGRDGNGGVTNDAGMSDPGTCRPPRELATVYPFSPGGAFVTITPQIFGETTHDLWFYCGNCGSATGRGGYRGGLQKLPKAGGKLSVVYEPPEAAPGVWFKQGSAMTGRGEVLFSTPPYNAASQVDTLLRLMPEAGGTPSIIAGASAPDNATPFEPGALDESNVFFSRGRGVYRVGRGGGAAVEIAELDFKPDPALANVPDMTIVGDDLIVSVQRGPVIRTPKNASTKAQQVTVTASNPCPTRRLWPVPGGFYCADTWGITRYNASLNDPTTIYRLPGSIPNPPRYERRLFIVGIDSNHVFFVSGTETSAFTLRTFDVGDTTTKLVGCLPTKVVAGVMDSSSVYLVEQDPSSLTRILAFPR